jgi:hypothetical protein
MKITDFFCNPCYIWIVEYVIQEIKRIKRRIYSGSRLSEVQIKVVKLLWGEHLEPPLCISRERQPLYHC